MKAGIYARISLDKDGENVGTDRQVKLCREKATALGWEVAETYVDNSISATSAKPRPEYERLIADLRAGTIGAVLVYAVDRLTRKPAELESFIELVEAKGVALANVAGDVQLDTEYGRFMARMMGNVARLEAERLGKRVSDQKADRAARGIPHKGRHRLFGYDDDWNVIPAEEAIVTEAFTRRASGESTTSICRDFTSRGVKTVSGRDWTSGVLGETLTKHVYAGKVTYKGEVVADSIYPALVDFATFNAAQANLANDSRGTNARTYLLSGILVCRNCLTHMKGNPSNHMYRCAATYGGCGKLSVRIKMADDWALWAAMNKHHEMPSKPVQQPRNYQVELDSINTEIERVRSMTREGIYSIPEGAKEIRELNAKLTAVSKEQAKSLPRVNRATQSYLDWNKKSLSQRRVFIGEYVESIVVGPSISRGNQPFNPGRFEFHYTDGTVYVPTLGDSLG